MKILNSKIIIWLLLVASCSSFVQAMSKPVKANTDHQVFVGVFEEGAPRNMNYIKKYVERVGKKPAMVMWYQDWAQNFPWKDSMNVIEYGAIPHIVWEPWYWGNHSKIKPQDILDGKWDKYIRTWAQEIKNFRHPIFLRVAHEFNIEGYPWGLVNNDKDPATYIKMIRHIVDIFKKEKVENVKWVWAPMNISYPDESWNDWVKSYPGDDYVDWVGFDGYNWGTTQSWSDWQSFKVLFQDQIRRAKRLWPDKPIMIAEFASGEKGGDKAAWIKEIPQYLKSSMRDIDLIIWFDENKETDWRIKSSKKSLAAYEEIMKDPIFSSSGEGLANLVVSSSRATAVKRVAKAPKASKTITINGDLSDWNKSQPIAMNDVSFLKEGINWSGPEDLSGNAYLMWDETNFYIAAEINDVIPMVNNQKKQNIWNGDALELVFSANPAAPANRSSFANRDYQVGLSTGDGKSNEPTIWNWQRRRVPKGSEISVKKSRSNDGYTLEASIPWKFFRPKFVPAKGVKLPFDIAFDDADKSGVREKQFIWNGDYYFYKDPSVWGILELQ